MTCDEAYSLFESLIKTAHNTLFDQTLNFPFKFWTKEDSTWVTECDQRIDNVLTPIIRNKGLFTVSEEGEHLLEVVEGGNYVTIDPIDGTFGYLDYLSSGLWDILPGAVASRCFGAELTLEFDKYVQLPNQGLVIKKGNWPEFEI